jgi:nucleoside-specific outer membrane channel protein Tsx
MGSLIGEPYSFGYPFKLYVENGYSYDFYLKNGFTDSSRILWLGLTADILVALIVSFAIGYIFRFVWSEIRARPLNLK